MDFHQKGAVFSGVGKSWSRATLPSKVSTTVEKVFVSYDARLDVGVELGKKGTLRSILDRENGPGSVVKGLIRVGKQIGPVHQRVVLLKGRDRALTISTFLA